MLKRTTTLLAFVVVAAQHPGAGRYPDMPPGRPPTVDVPDAVAAAEADMRPYRERIVGVGDGDDGGELALDMTPIPGGEFLLGSPESEPGRGEMESPRRRVRVGPFWMATHETTWDLYRVFMFDTDRGGAAPSAAWADAVSRPTPPYRPMDFGMGVEGFPAISMTQFAARHFTKWLSMKTGRFYRLPTEAEWEYACRGSAGVRASDGVSASADGGGAGTGTGADAGGASAGDADTGTGAGEVGADAAADAPWSFGDDPAEIDRFAWHAGNSGRRYHEVAQLEPNAWGLFDMHGNVAEWTLDAYASYAELGEADLLLDPVAWPEKEYPRSVRGGSWRDEPATLRCAARRGSELGWKRMDPQLPQSVWYHTNARFLGLRVVRPLVEPPVEEQERYWAPDVASVRRIVERQRRGERD